MNGNDHEGRVLFGVAIVVVAAAVVLWWLW